MKLRNNNIDGFFRKLIPSTAILSYNPIFVFVGRINDFLVSRIIPEFRDLPPNHLRVRVGVGNKIFNNQVLCMLSGYNFWINLIHSNCCRLDSDITEIGCGYGRKSVVLKNYESQGEKYTGRYHSIDIDEELLEFARKYFADSPNFTFQKSPHKSETYTKSNETTTKLESSTCTVERPDSSQDLVFSTSLFTHLLETEMTNYLEESYRILKPGGCMQMNVFLYDFLNNSDLLGSRFNFTYRIGNAYIESQKYPEAAVAYDESFLRALCTKIGFSRIEILKDEAHRVKVQSFLRCWK